MNHQLLARYGWILVLRGALGLLLGTAAGALGLSLAGYPTVFWGHTLWFHSFWVLSDLILIVGLYALVDGFFCVLFATRPDGSGRLWWYFIAEGLGGIALGTLTLLRPEMSLSWLLNWIAFWALATGLLEMNQALCFAEYRERRWPLLIGGALSVLFGFGLVFFNLPALELIGWVACYAVTFGACLIYLGIRLQVFFNRYRHQNQGHAAR